MIKAVGSFGGGIAASGRVCGALLGAVALISSIYGRGNLDDNEDPRLWRLSRSIVRSFEKLAEPFGSINCRDIAQVDWKDKKAKAEFYSHPQSRRKHCIQLVGGIAYSLGELLEREGGVL